MDVNSIQHGLAPSADGALARLRAGELERIGSTSTSKEAGQRFEEILGTMLAREMRRGLDEGFFGSGPGADTFNAWLDDFVGRAMAQRGALGTGALVRNFAEREIAEASAAQGDGAANESVANPGGGA